MPLFWPIAQTYKIDPIWLGILVAVNLQTAFLSPPGVELSDIWWGMMPFMGLQIPALLMIYFFPQLALWLPSLLIK